MYSCDGKDEFGKAEAAINSSLQCHIYYYQYWKQLEKQETVIHLF